MQIIRETEPSRASDNTYRPSGAFFDHWGADAKRDFLGRRALRFLGFDDPTNKNNERLRGRYESFAKDRMPDWLCQPD